MVNAAPNRVDALALAEKGGRVGGRYPVAGMKRLVGYLAATDAEVDVDLHFSVSDNGARVIAGTIVGELELVCQRCMEPMTVRIDIDVSLGIVDSEEKAELLDDAYEPIITSDGQILIRDLLEDELILGLPIVARHPLSECKAKIDDEDAGGDERERPNPFAVLEKLKSAH